MKEDIYSKLLDYVNKTEMFFNDQLPDFFNQIINYGKYMGIIGLLISIFIVVLSIFIIKNNKHTDYESIKFATKYFVFFAVLCLFGLCIVYQIDVVYKAFFAPKLYILDYLKK